MFLRERKKRKKDPDHVDSWPFLRFYGRLGWAVVDVFYTVQGLPPVFVSWWGWNSNCPSTLIDFLRVRLERIEDEKNRKQKTKLALR